MLLPTRGSGPILADAVSSVLDQDHAEIELVVSEHREERCLVGEQGKLDRGDPAASSHLLPVFARMGDLA